MVEALLTLVLPTSDPATEPRLTAVLRLHGWGDLEVRVAQALGTTALCAYGDLAAERADQAGGADVLQALGAPFPHHVGIALAPRAGGLVENGRPPAPAVSVGTSAGCA